MEVILFHKCVLRNQLKKANLGLHITRLSQREGAQISEVEEGSPAKRAGLQRGDRLLCINNKNVERENITNILKILQIETNKDEVIIKIARKQQIRAYENHPIPLAPVEEEPNIIKPDMNNSKLISNFITKPHQMTRVSAESIKSAHGMTVAPDPETGNIVTHVLPNSQASQAGINVNDTIVQINDDVIINYPFSHIRKLLLGDPTEKMKLYVCPRTELIRRMHMGLPIVTQYNPDSVSKGTQKLIKIGGDLKSSKPKKYLGSQTLPILNAEPQGKHLPVNNTPGEHPTKKVNFNLNMPRKTPYRFYENVTNPLNNGGTRRFQRFLNYSEQARSDPQLNTIHIKQPINQLHYPTVIKLPNWKPAYENDESTEESDTNVIRPTNVLLPNDSNDSLSQLSSSHMMPVMKRSEKQGRLPNPFQKTFLYRDGGIENLKRSISMDDLRPTSGNYNPRCICVMEHVPVTTDSKQQQSTVNATKSEALAQEMSSSNDAYYKNTFEKRELTPIKNAEICVSIKKQPAPSVETGKNAPTKKTGSNVKNVHIDAEDESTSAPETNANGSATMEESNGIQSLRKRKRHKKEFSRSPAKTDKNGSSTTNDEAVEKENTKRPLGKTTKIVPVDIKTSNTGKKKNSREQFTSTHEVKITKIPVSSNPKSAVTRDLENTNKPNPEQVFKSTVIDNSSDKPINGHPVSVHSIHEDDDDELTLIAQSTYNPFKEKKLPSMNHQYSSSIIPVKRIGQMGNGSPDEVYTNECRQSLSSTSDNVSVISSNRDGFDGTTNFSNAFTQTDESIHTDVVFRDLSSRIDDIDSLMDSYDMTPSAFAALENQDNTDDSRADNANNARAIMPMDYMNGKSNLIIKEFDKDIQQNLNSNREHYMILKKEKGKDEKKTAIILRRIEDRFIETKVVNATGPSRLFNTFDFDKTKSVYDNVSEMVLVNVVRGIKPEDKLGLKLKENRKYPHKIINVENESVCSKAGLKAETLILSVNDKDTTRMTFDEIQKHILDGKKEGVIKFVTIQEKHYKELKGR